MSALTDLFTAFANKIRSKTGGSDTYTPPQMVNAIDDVYQAGVDAGTTPTQTKTVTAGTSATTVTPDTGYALSSVTVNPTPTETKSDTPNVSTNKTVSPSSGKYLSQVTIQPLTHSGTYTPAANTAQNDMGAYHDKRYVNTSGMIVPSGNKSITANGTGIDVSSYATASVSVSGTSITPNNSSPASMSSGTLYTPSASGYAISSYSSVTPSNSSPVSLSSGSIYKMGGAGKAVASVTSVAPSNSSPATLTSGTVYKPSANGVAISSYSSITPSSSSQSVSSGSIYKMGGNGVVVDALPTITSITPLDSLPIGMTANNNYKPTVNSYAITSYERLEPSATPYPISDDNMYFIENEHGYIIDSYENVTPTADGIYFSSGMKKMSQPGWAYLEQQQGADLSSWTQVGTTSAKGTYTVPTKGAYLFYTWGYTEKNGGSPGTPGTATFTRNGTSCSASIDKTDSFSFNAGSGTRYVKHRKQMIIDMFDAGETVYSSKGMTIYSTVQS